MHKKPSGAPRNDKRQDSSSSKDKGRFDERKKDGAERRPYKSDDKTYQRKDKRQDARDAEYKPSNRNERSERNFKSDGKAYPRTNKRQEQRDGEYKPSDRAERSERGFRNDDKRGNSRTPFRDNKPSQSESKGGFEKKRHNNKTDKYPKTKPFEEKKPREETPADFYKKHTKKPYNKSEDPLYDDYDAGWEIAGDKRKKTAPVAAKYPMPLNKYIAHSGECSRRDAAELVKQGKAKVNGELITDPGHKINENDKVTLSGKKLVPQKGMVYILLNKPKGFITTNDDPRGRRTVIDLISNADVGRVFPVGRLDRATTGLLLITNDGDVAQKLAHPSHNVKKVYHVTLNNPLSKVDFDKILGGLELEDGKATVDEMAYLDKKNEIGLEIHSGKNRIVRRIFESLGYVVEKLDRMMYAGLTKKNLPRGKWRFLTEREIILLKHFKS